jgi:glycosyltransferase involved in cell wall biosynthesis
VNSKTLSIVNKKNRKLITIVHEMKDVISLFDRLKINNSSDVISKSDKIIAVSRAVEKDLILHNNVQENKIKVITNTISYFDKIKASDEDILQWKSTNNVSNEDFLVGTCGGPIWRKGPDIFLNTVKNFVRTYPKEKVCFIWQGGDPKSAAFLNFEREILRLDLGDYVRIIPTSKKIHFFYNAIDLLISTSREEPFGLTILEAGLYKVPCIAFEKSGGPEEILSGNKGIIIPYGNFQNAANEIYSLKNNKRKRNFFSKELNKYSLESSMENNFLKYKKIVDLYSR